MAEVTMPKLSDTMEEGKLLRWLKRPGDRVDVGEILAEVETDKADMELEASVAGEIRELRLGEGESAPVGAVIAVIEAGADGGAATGDDVTASSGATDGETESASAIAEPSGRELQSEPPEPARSAAPAVSKPVRGEGKRVETADRRVATQRGAAAPPRRPEPARDAAPRGEPQRGGASGVVRVRPPAPAAPARAPAAGPEGVPLRTRRVPLSRMRASIARRMAESKREAPHFYLTAVASMDEAVRLRAGLRAAAGEDRGVTFNHMVLKACADALAVFPEMNARFAGDAIEIAEEVNLGVAIALEDGLLVPVIHGADRLSLFELAERARTLGERAQTGNFAGPDLSGATFSVSNLGMFGVETFAAVINPPQAGILAVGSVELRPVVRHGAVVPGHTMAMTLSCDHRVVDGAQGARFLAEVRRRLENPISLLVEAAGA